MKDSRRHGVRGLACALAFAWLGMIHLTATAQTYAPPSGRVISTQPAPMAPANYYDPSVRRTQDAPPVPAPSVPVGDAPGTEIGDLALPAAEREFTGGGPTENVAATEAAAEAEAEETGVEQHWLMGALGAGDSPIKFYGWIQNSFTGNANGNNKPRINFGVAPNFQANQWMGNQYYFILENALEQNDEINFGFRVDSLFGNDWAFNYMQGLLNNVFRPIGSFAGYDPAQFYGEVHLPVLTEGGIDVKVGRFYTLAGYEVVPAIGRPLLSVPYMFTFGQPFTHMGVMTTTHLTDRINVYNGLINGWDRFINERYQPGYMGGFSWTSEDEKTALAFTTVWGANQFPRFLPGNQQIYPTGYINVPSAAGFENPGYNNNYRLLFTTVLTHKWTDKLTQVIETDQGMERNVPGLASNIVDGVVQTTAAKSQQWQSFGNWFLYQITPKLTGVWRSEVFWDQQGGRVGIQSEITTPRGKNFVGDRFYEMTAGLIWKPQPWLWVRPEVRYDWTQYHPYYDSGTKKSQFTGGLDVIITF
jgi:hypothetical protein